MNNSEASVAGKPSETLYHPYRTLLVRNVASAVWWMLVITMVMGLLLPVAAAVLSDSMNEGVNERRRQTYGNHGFAVFQSAERLPGDPINWNALDHLPVDLGKSELFWRHGDVSPEAYLYTLESNVPVGVLSDGAASWVHLHFVEGAYDVDDGKAAVASSYALQQGLSAGDDVHAGNRTFVISGVYRDFGALWTKPEVAIQGGYADPLVLVSKADAAGMGEAVSDIWRVALFSEVIEPRALDDERAVVNPGPSLSADSDVYRFITFLQVFMIPLTMLLVARLMKLELQRKETFSRSLHQQGMRPSLIANLFFVTMMSALAGAIIIAGSFLAVYQGFHDRIPPWRGLFAWRALTLSGERIIIAAVYVFVYLVMAAAFSRQMRRTRMGYRESRRRRKRHEGLGFTLFQTFMVFVLVFFTFLYLANYRENALFTSGANGLPVDYDFAVFVSDQPNAPYQGDSRPVYFYSWEDRLGVSDETADKILTIDGVSRVDRYKQSAHFYLDMQGRELDPLVDLWDGFEDQHADLLHPFANIDAEEGPLGVSNRSIETQIMGYSDEELRGFDEFVVEGEINIDRIREGSEVIFMVPTYDYVWDDTMYIQSINPEGEYGNETWKVGDEIELYYLRPTSDYSELGSIAYDEEQLEENFEKTVIRTRIGAIINDRVGYQSGPVGWSFPSPYNLLVSNATLDAWGYDDIATRYLRIYTDGETDPDLIQAHLLENLSGNERLGIDVNIRRIQSYRETSQILNLMFGSFIAWVIVTAVLAISSGFYSQIFARKRVLMLMRVNGMPHSRLAWSLIRPYLLTYLSSLLITLVIGYLVLSSLFEVYIYNTFTDVSLVAEAVSNPAFVVVLGLIFLLLILAFVPGIRFLRKVDLTER